MRWIDLAALFAMGVLWLFIFALLIGIALMTRNTRGSGRLRACDHLARVTHVATEIS